MTWDKQLIETGAKIHHETVVITEQIRILTELQNEQKATMKKLYDSWYTKNLEK